MATTREEVRSLLEQREASAKWRGVERGALGILSSGAWIFDVPGRPGYVYVRIQRGSSVSIIAAINNAVQQKPDIKVLVGQTIDGIPTILGLDASSMNVEAGSSASNMAVPPHSHTEAIPARRLLPGLVHVTTPASLSVYVRPFVYTYNGQDQTWEGGSLDLTSHVPSDASKKRWVKVGVNPATNAAVATSGADYSAALTLSDLPALLDDISFTGYIPLAGIVLQTGQTSIEAEIDFVDYSWLRGDAMNGETWLLHNMAATAAPTVNDDSGDGYAVGSRWHDTTNDKWYVCLDATATAAVWVHPAQVGSAETVTGLWTFDRDPNAPFAVSASSAVVTNLDADKLDGLDATEFVRTNPVADQVINDNSGDYDLRIEGNNDANLLVLDAGTDRIGIGKTGPAHKLDLVGTIYASQYVYQAGTYAEIHVHDASAAQTIGTGTTYTKLTAWTSDGLSSNCTPDQANDKITFTHAGIYRVSGSFSFSCGTNNTTFFITVFLDGVEQDNVHCERKIGTAGDKGNAGFTGFIDVTSAPLDLDTRVRHDDAGDVNITVYYANLNVEYIGET